MKNIKDQDESMTVAEKDKIWCDYMVTIICLNNTCFKNSLPIQPIMDFHTERKNAIDYMQKTGKENFQSWNWKWGERIFT